MLRLSLKCIRFFRQQFVCVLLGMVAIIVIPVVVDRVFEKNTAIALNRAGEISGDYHYVYDHLSTDDISRAYALMDECSIDKIGYVRVGREYSVSDNPVDITLKSANDDYKEMMGIELLEGYFPELPGGIALEEGVLALFSDGRIGAQIELNRDGHTDVYTVTGILKDREKAKGDLQKSGYVSWFDVEGGDCRLFIKYDETKNIKIWQSVFDMKFGRRQNYKPLDF